MSSDTRRSPSAHKALGWLARREGTSPDRVVPFIKSELSEFAEEICRQPQWTSRFCAEYISNELERLAVCCSTDAIGAGTGQHLEHFLNELDQFAHRKLCVVALEGVALALDRVVLGPFTLRLGNEAEINRLQGLLTEAFSRTKHTKDGQAALAKSHGKHLTRTLNGCVLAELELVADPQKAHDIFREKVRSLVDILQFGASGINFCQNVRVAIKGESHTDYYAAWILPVNSAGMFQPNVRTGPFGELSLDEASLRVLKAMGAVRMCQALGKDCSDLEGSILRALHWFAQSRTQATRQNELVNLITTLETILCPGTGPIRHLIAEGVALLTSDSPTQRALPAI